MKLPAKKEKELNYQFHHGIDSSHYLQ